MHQVRAGVCLLGLSLLVRSLPSEHARDLVRVECDSLVHTRTSDPLRYQRRGDRCEGVYGQNVSGTSTLRVVSLVDSVEAFDDTSSLPLRVEWSAPEGAAVVLRASPLRAGLFYRMETERPIATSRWAWPSDVRSPLRIGRADVGVTGATTMLLGGVRREVLVPLRIGQRRAPARAERYRLTLWPSIALSEVYLTVAATGADGAPTRYLLRDEKLGYGYYPADRAIEVRLPPLGGRGVYSVRAAATREGGGGATTSVMLFHAGAKGAVSP